MVMSMKGEIMIWLKNNAIGILTTVGSIAAILVSVIITYGDIPKRVTTLETRTEILQKEIVDIKTLNALNVQDHIYIKEKIDDINKKLDIMMNKK